MSKVGEYYRELEEMGIDPNYIITIEEKKMLCDGDCGNCYHEKDLDRNCEGNYMCNDCMFYFTWEQEWKQGCDQ